VTEILFFHLQNQPLEKVLPTLLSRSLERGWRAIVKASSEERLKALDDHLWTFSDESFLPHGTDLQPDADAHPVLLTLGDANSNGATVLFLVENAPLPAEIAAYDRVTLLFDGEDVEALAGARETWSAVKRAGHEATYWQETPAGRWEKKA
jgi:DNA polymerase-3 subunit chi